jgi:hypothetical protein
LELFRQHVMLCFSFWLHVRTKKNVSYQRYKTPEWFVWGARSFKIITCPNTDPKFYLFILYMVLKVHIYIMKWKSKQWWSSRLTISTKQTITSHLIRTHWIERNTTTYDVGNTGPDFGPTQACGVILWLMGSHLSTFDTWISSWMEHLLCLYNC